MNEKFGGMPVIIAHFDKDYNITSEEYFNMENFKMADWQVKALARALLPSIRKHYENEENVRAFEEWQKKRAEKT